MTTHDPEFYNAPKYASEPPPSLPKQHGCFFYGCIIASVVGVLFVILLGVVSFIGYKFVMNLRDQYTSTTPNQLPTVVMPEEQRRRSRSVRRRFARP